MRLFTQSEKPLPYKWRDVTFFIRPQATVGDKTDMTHEFSGEIIDGKYQVKKTNIFPWVVERFVMSWQGVKDEADKDVPFSMHALRSLPSDPQEDIILALGAFIMNHTGLTNEAAQGDKKKG